jgi:hypothetical protein
MSAASRRRRRRTVEEVGVAIDEPQREWSRVRLRRCDRAEQHRAVPADDEGPPAASKDVGDRVAQGE